MVAGPKPRKNQASLLLLPSPLQRRSQGAVESLVPVVAGLDNGKLWKDSRREVRGSIRRMRLEILAAPYGGTDDAVSGAAKP